MCKVMFAVLNKHKMFVSWISERNYYAWGKNLFSLSRVLQDLWDGEKSKTSFSWRPRSRGDFYLLPILDKERIGEIAKQVTI